MIRNYALFILLGCTFSNFAATLHIGSGQPYASIQQAAAVARPGDTLLIHTGTYAGGQYIENLKGTANAWIFIRNAPGASVIVEGGTNAIQFTDPAYLHLSGLIFQRQKGNGLNIDDGGSYDSPAHHLIFENCTFRDMSASGNNDLLKLSGLDHFEIRRCTFLNGAAGGSGVDMVGCHQGIITGNYFENMGSNAIQAKGGTEHIRMEGNFFRNCGQRTLNLGGSTGLQFFRPLNAPFEAANLQVYSNIFIGSVAPIAYVGCVHVEVVNNTIYRPENWVIRILQETVDPSRFLACGDNIFRNNIVVLGDNLRTETNIGPNTRPESFTFSNNLWFNVDDNNWGGPSIPVQDANGLINANPLLVNPTAGDFHIQRGSPAAGAGFGVSEPEKDYYRQTFGNPRSIGAAEAEPVTGLFAPINFVTDFLVYPNPGGDRLAVKYTLAEATTMQVALENASGQQTLLLPQVFQAAGHHEHTFDVAFPAGWYILKLTASGNNYTQRWVRIR